LSGKAVGSALYRLWKSGVVLRTEKPCFEAFRAFGGRGGVKRNTRAYHLYLFAFGRDSASFRGVRFVKYDEKHLDRRGSG